MSDIAGYLLLTAIIAWLTILPAIGVATFIMYGNPYLAVAWLVKIWRRRHEL